MADLSFIADEFVAFCREILKEKLVGVYLHGSGAMGCFHEAVSDVDLLVVIEDGLTDEEKLCFMEKAVALHALAPPKGLEFSIVRRAVCRPFVYPTPYELHFSVAHKVRYEENPRDYISRTKGTDKDLAAHAMVTYHRGRCLFGADIKDVFEDVGHQVFFDSIWYDIQGAREEILTTPVYVILNLCRALAYREEGLILSKQEGGQWARQRVSASYLPLVQGALDAYASLGIMEPDQRLAQDFAEEMLGLITQ